MIDQPSSQVITIHTCRAIRGVSWWKNAYFLVRQHPFHWWLLGTSYFLCLGILMTVFSELGRMLHFNFLYLIATIVQPCFMIGLVSAAWNQVKKVPLKFTDLLNGFKADVKTLLGIGLSVAILSLVLTGICQLIWGHGFFMNGLRDTDSFQSFLASYGDSYNMFISVSNQICFYTICSLLIQAAAFFAPLIATFLRARVVNSMVTSFKACFINWLSMLVSGLFIMLCIFIFMFVVGFVFAIFGKIIGDSNILLVLPVVLAIILVPLYISLNIIWIFVAYCDIFHPEDKVFD